LIDDLLFRRRSCIFKSKVIRIFFCSDSIEWDMKVGTSLVIVSVDHVPSHSLHPRADPFYGTAGLTLAEQHDEYVLCKIFCLSPVAHKRVHILKQAPPRGRIKFILTSLAGSFQL